MKKVAYFTIFTFILAIGTNVLAEVPMPVMNQINSQIFTPEATRPLNNLERDYKTNSDIMKLQEKSVTPKENKKTEDENQNHNVQVNSSEQKKEKTKFKDLFKGFTVEW